MISDRPPIRGEYQRENTPVTTWLVCALAAAFLIQFMVESRLLSVGSKLSEEFALSIDGLKAGHFWTAFTYWIFHSTSNLLHIGLVVVGLLLLSRELARPLGAKRFVVVFGTGLMMGGVAWAVINWQTGGTLTGATAGVYALFAFYALSYPHRKVEFLFLFVPLSCRIRHLTIGLLLIDLLALFLINIIKHPLPFSYAPAAHLGGMLAGCVCHRFFHRPLDFPRVQTSSIGSPNLSATVSGTSGLASQAIAKSVTPTSNSIRAEADRVLDKINTHGFGALTPDERRILGEAKALLNRR